VAKSKCISVEYFRYSFQVLSQNPVDKQPEFYVQSL